MKITELFGVIRLNVSNYVAGMDQAIKKTGELQTSFVKAATDIERAASRITGVVVATATGVAAATTKMGFSFLQSRDSAEIMLGTILKDSKLAKKTLDELFVAAKKTPFSFEGLKDGMVQLANAKMAADKLIPSLYKVSDAVAAVGGSDADIKGVTYALSQMMTAGRLNAQDMMQLTNRGIAGWDILAEKLGASVAEVRKASESGAIDGRMAAEMIIQGMGERFAGAGDKLSQKFQGLWSSFMDQARANAGQIIEPLYDAVGRVLGRMNAGVDAGAAGGFIERMRAMVGSFAQTLEQLATNNGPQALEMIVSGFERLGTVGNSVLNYLAAQGPALAANAQAWASLLTPILEFLSVHPELVMALLFFKGGQMLGVNQAIISLTQLFWNLGRAMPSMVSGGVQFSGWLVKDGIPSLLAYAGVLKDAIARVTGLNVGLLALKAGGVAAAIAAIGLLAKVIYDANQHIRKLNEETEKGLKLSERIAGKQADRRSATLAKAAAAEASQPGSGRAILEAELGQARREMAGAQASAAGAKSHYDFMYGEIRNRSVIESAVSSVLGLAKQDMIEAQENAQRASDYVLQLEKELQQIPRLAHNPAMNSVPYGAAAAGVPVTASGGSLADMMAAREADKAAKKLTKDEERAAKRAEAKEETEAQRRLEQTTDMLADFKVKLAELQDRFTPQQLQEYSAWLNQISEDYREGEYNAREYQNQLDLVNRFLKTDTAAADAKTDFKTRARDAFDNLEQAGASDSTKAAFQQEANALYAELANLALQFQDGEISAKQFADGVQGADRSLSEAAQVAQQITTAQTNLSKQIADEQMQMQQQVSKGLLSQNTVGFFNKMAAGIQGQMDALAQQFQAGDINAQQFAVGVEKLRNQMQLATQAALEQEKIERRQWMLRLMSGQGSAQDYQRLMVQQQQAYWEQFDANLTNTFNMMTGLGNAAGNLASGFTNINTGLQQFGTNLNQIGQGAGNAPGIQEAWNGIAGLLNSEAGQRAIISNNIQMLQQALSVVDTYPQQKRILDQIAALQGQLNAMNKPTAPLFSGWNMDVTSKRGGGVGTQNITQTLSFPNWSPQNSADLKYFADQLAAEFERRGAKLF